MDFIDRREWFRRSAMLSFAGTLPMFLRSATAAETNGEKILVVVELAGGNDGLNTVVPLNDDTYHASRKTLRLEDRELISINDSVAMHGAMRGMADLFEQNRLAIVQGVGYPAPSRSHEISASVWHTASTDTEDHDGYGWIGRALDKGRATGPTSLLVSDRETPRALRGRRSAPIAVDNLDEFRAVVPMESAAGATDHESNVSGFLRQAAFDASVTAERIAGIAKRTEVGELGRIPGKFGRQLKTISDLILSDFGPRVYYCMHEGYDTHADQLGLHASLLGTLSRSLKAFLDDIQAAGLADRVAVLCFSEFGRQVQENASGGTDHGTAGPVFLAGKNVQGGLFGKAPDLTRLRDNAPDYTTDFRAVYASVLEDWMGVSHESIIGSRRERLSLFS
ncbi:MAG: DUF1501 domain-containing protein [Planctomycetota bacterium]